MFTKGLKFFVQMVFNNKNKICSMGDYDTCNNTSCEHYRKDHPGDGKCCKTLSDGNVCQCQTFVPQ